MMLSELFSRPKGRERDEKKNSCSFNSSYACSWYVSRLGGGGGGEVIPVPADLRIPVEQLLQMTVPAEAEQQHLKVLLQK